MIKIFWKEQKKKKNHNKTNVGPIGLYICNFKFGPA